MDKPVMTLELYLVILEIKLSMHLKRELAALGHTVHLAPDEEDLDDTHIPMDPALPSAVVIVTDEQHRKDLRHLVGRIGAVTSRPVIVISPELGEADRLGLLRGGAIAIIENTYSVREIALRVHRMLDVHSPRDDPQPATQQSWQYGPDTLLIDESAHKVFLNGRYIRLTETEWRLLHYLASRWDAICSREAIIHESMGYDDAYPYLRSLDAHVKNLRKKLDNPGWIETVRGYGYQFMGQRPGGRE